MGRRRCCWRSRRPMRRAHRGRRARGRPRSARGPTARAPAPRGRVPRRGRTPPRAAAASTDATSASAWRPAAAQWTASSAGPAVPRAPSSSASRPWSRSRSPGRTVAYTASASNGWRNLKLRARRRRARPGPRRPQGLVQVAIGSPASAAATGTRPRPRRSRPAAARRVGPVELGEAAQQQVPHTTWQRFPRSRAAASSSSAKNGLPAARATMASSAAGAAPVGVGRRAALADRRRPAAPARPRALPRNGARRRPAGHAFAPRRLGRATGRHEHHPQVDDVVGQEDDEVERRDVGPVEILQHDQQRVIAARSDSNASTDSNTCNCEPRTSSRTGSRADATPRRTVGTAAPPRRGRSTGRAAPRTLGARAPRDLGRQSRLADAGVARHEHGRSLARACEVEALDITELALASHEDTAPRVPHAAASRTCPVRYE